MRECSNCGNVAEKDERDEPGERSGQGDLDKPNDLNGPGGPGERDEPGESGSLDEPGEPGDLDVSFDGTSLSGSRGTARSGAK